MTGQLTTRLVLLLACVALAAGAANGPSPAVLQQFEAGQYLAAARQLESALAQSPQNAALAWWLARCYYEMRDVDRAVEFAERAVRLDPKNSAYHLLLGHATGRKASRDRSLGLARRTKRAFEDAVSADPRNVGARRALLDYLSSAPWIAGGNKGEARRQAEAIAALDPVQGHLAWADYWMNDDKPERVREELSKLLARPAAAGADAYAEAAGFYEKLGDAAGMEKAAAAGARAAPRDTRWDYYRAVALVIKGTAEAPAAGQAEELLRGYLARQHPRTGYPTPVSAHLWLGRYYEQTGQCARAAEEYRSVLTMDSSNRQAAEGWRRTRDRC